MKGLRHGAYEKLASVKVAATLTTTLLFLLPLLYVEGYNSYTSLRYYLFGIAALVLGSATVWTWFSMGWIPRRLFAQWHGYGLAVFALAFGIVSLTSIDRVTSFFSTFQRTDGLFTIVFVTLFALSTYTLIVVRGKKMLYSLLGASVIGATILSLLTMLSPDGIGTWFTQARSGVTTGNSSVAGTYVLFHLFFALILFATAKKTSSKVWWMTACGILGLSPLFVNWQVLMGQTSFSGMTSLIGVARGAAMGIVFGAIIAVVTYLALQKNAIKKSIGIGLLVLVLGGTIMGGIQLFNPTTTIHQRFVDQASGMRFIFWDIAWQGFTERPVFGWGPGTFDTVYHALYKPEMLLQPNGGEMWVDRTHNLFFETLVTGGVLLSAALLFFLASIIGGVVRGVRKGYLSPLEASLLIGAFAGWLLQAQFIFESVLSLAMLFLLASIAYASGASSEGRHNPAELGRAQKTFFYLFVCCSIALFVVAIALPHTKDRRMYTTFNTQLPARASMWQQLGGVTPMGDGYDSVWMFNKVYKAYNGSAESLRKENEEMKKAVLDELDGVSAYLLKLSQERRHDYGIHLLGEQMLYLRMRIANDFTGEPLHNAQVLAEKTIQLAPTDPQAYWMLSQLQTVSHNLTGAQQTLERALVLEPKLGTTHQFILLTARNMKDPVYYQSSLVRAQELIPGFTPEF